jgi:hypothetical protein
MPESRSVPKGLVFFAGRPSPGHRLRRTLFVLVFALTSLALIWPLYALVTGTSPLLLGLPPSFAWTVAWLLVSFLSLIWLYRTEESD